MFLEEALGAPTGLVHAIGGAVGARAQAGRNRRSCGTAGSERNIGGLYDNPLNSFNLFFTTSPTFSTAGINILYGVKIGRASCRERV